MNRTSPKLSIEKHREAGRQLKRHRDYLVSLITDLGRLDNNRGYALKPLHRALGAVDDARARLDGQLALDWPAEFSPRVYYPGQPSEEEGP